MQLEAALLPERRCGCRGRFNLEHDGAALGNGGRQTVGVLDRFFLDHARQSPGHLAPEAQLSQVLAVPRGCSANADAEYGGEALRAQEALAHDCEQTKERDDLAASGAPAAGWHWQDGVAASRVVTNS